VTCRNYQILNARLAKAADGARTSDTPLEKSHEFQQQLFEIRVHLRYCPDCIVGLAGAFPELKNKTLTMQALVPEDPE
jgi:hypothetical protein